MATTDERLAHAQQRADRARDRLIADVFALWGWLHPSRLLGKVVRKTRASAAGTASAGVAAVRDRPALFAGGIALAALFLARKPIARALSRATAETPPASPRSPVKRARASNGRALSKRKARP